MRKMDNKQTRAYNIKQEVTKKRIVPKRVFRARTTGSTLDLARVSNFILQFRLLRLAKLQLDSLNGMVKAAGHLL